MTQATTLRELKETEWGSPARRQRTVKSETMGGGDATEAAWGGLGLSAEVTMHIGLLQPAIRAIFAVIALSNLAGEVQVGLFTRMQEAGVPVKGYPVRLNMDVSRVVTA